MALHRIPVGILQYYPVSHSGKKERGLAAMLPNLPLFLAFQNWGLVRYILLNQGPSQPCCTTEHWVLRYLANGRFGMRRLMDRQCKNNDWLHHRQRHHIYLPVLQYYRLATKDKSYSCWFISGLKHAGRYAKKPAGFIENPPKEPIKNLPQTHPKLLFFSFLFH